MLSDSDDEEFQQSSGGGKELQNALHMAVGTICRQQDISTNDITPAGPTPQTSNEAIECITQMTFHYATKCLAKDLVAFCKHANRKTITVDDVKLVARKNPRGLLDSLDGFCDNSTSNLKERKRTNIMGSNVNIGMGVGINNTAGGKQNNSKRDAMYDDSSSDDGLDALSRVIQSKRRKQSSDSSAGLGIDLQIGSSGSSSSDSDDSGMKVKSSHSQHTFKTLVKQNQNLNIQDDDESSSDDGIDNQTSTNIGGRKGNSSAPIELEDSDPD
eukprot:scaffold2408_cov279-Chaetoceros_neogracile.AAC.42